MDAQPDTQSVEPVTEVSSLQSSISLCRKRKTESVEKGAETRKKLTSCRINKLDANINKLEQLVSTLETIGTALCHAAESNLMATLQPEEEITSEPVVRVSHVVGGRDFLSEWRK